MKEDNLLVMQGLEGGRATLLEGRTLIFSDRNYCREVKSLFLWTPNHPKYQLPLQTST